MAAIDQRTILALNTGSSSLKFGVYEASADNAELLCEGEAESLGHSNSSFWFQQGAEDREQQQVALADVTAAVHHAFEIMKERRIPSPQAFGHRIVHGGARVRRHTRIRSDVLQDLEAAVPFAPLHVPSALAVLKEAQTIYPDLPHVACLDTAFHQTMPDVSRTLPLPDKIREMGVEKYGFHGLSVQSIVRRLSPVPERLVVAHLGGGSSITAVLNGKSIDNTMGLTPTGGVPMATRSGDLDPGVLLFLLRHGYAAADRMEDLLDHQSGLSGISEGVSDMRELEKNKDHDKNAALALRVFWYQVRRAIAGMAGALGGLDCLVFTGGIGEHARAWRTQVVEQLRFLGNFRLEVLPSQEDLMIAMIAAGLSE